MAAKTRTAAAAVAWAVDLAPENRRAQTLGFLFLLVGILWTIEAFASRPGNNLWWLSLIAGIMMIGLGFWVEGQLFPARAYTLLVFTGVWALVHGITDIIRAFQIKKLGSMTTAEQMTAI